jgi:ABC-type Fe3+ transport system substrate-binding protein
MRHPLISVVAATLCLLALVSGVSYAADIPAIRDAKDSAERTRVQALIDAARKENQLEWTGNMIEPKHANPLIAGFKEYYGLPQLKLSYTYAVANDIIARVEEVLKAGRTPPDITWISAWGWYVDLMKRGDIMRYESPYYKEYTLSSRAGNSMPGYWAADAYTANPMWNVKELEKRGIKNFKPSSWWDFADPKIAPNCNINNINTSSVGVSWAIGLRKVLGDDWFIKFAKGKPALAGKGDLEKRWVATGEYPIGVTGRTKNAQDLEESGLEIEMLWPKEGVVLFPFSPIIFAKAAHPNTAQLFVDYVRSAYGANRMAETGVGLIYGRPGVKVPEKERKFMPPSEDIKAIPMDWNKETSTEAVNALKEWAKKIDLSY